ncbi:hypothetical protein ASG67_17895 [Sphingomonas sp. Leaf339]|uniref:hypothetical protein n=1 Tax=Sphingomonas sp. Leaf339 TaxID=1736343 RepID=UPI0006FF1BEC|nr:hypothetical protein [Sphingomonas sp. Leaf339]KQU53958.1 hypothetical protein ASG67_17895 [Sphingomonas sp. Leaf339]
MPTVATVCANVMIYGLLGWAVVGWLGHRTYARVAGLFLAIGFAFGSFGGHAAAEPENILQLRALGSAMGLAALSALMFFRRRGIAQ